MDIVFITDLRVETIIGIYDWERTTLQTVSLDIEMATDISDAAATEDIEFALNYKSISKAVESFVADSKFLLVETLAERVAELIRNDFNVRWVRLTLHKPGALSCAKDVGIIIERGSRS